MARLLRPVGQGVVNHDDEVSRQRAAPRSMKGM
jgi:hypothetical protein